MSKSTIVITLAGTSLAAGLIAGPASAERYEGPTGDSGSSVSEASAYSCWLTPDLAVNLAHHGIPIAVVETDSASTSPASPDAIEAWTGGQDLVR